MTKTDGDNPESHPLPDLREVAQDALQSLAAAADTLAGCGLHHHATTIRSVVDEMRGVAPLKSKGTESRDFVVRATLLVPRAILFEVLAEVAAGSGSWYQITDFARPALVEMSGSESRIPHIRFPLTEGGALILSAPDAEPKAYRLDLFTISLGLEVMAGKYPQQFANLLNEKEGPETADVFLQCCLFGAVIYSLLPGRPIH